MSRELSKKSFHLDLPKYLKGKSAHPYNLRPRRKRVNYNETRTNSSNNKILLEDDIQIDLNDSSSSKQSSRTSLKQEVHDPVELVTHFVNKNFGDTSTTELGGNNKGLEVSNRVSENEENHSDDGDHGNNQESMEKQTVETVREMRSLDTIDIDEGTIEHLEEEMEGDEDPYQESYSNATNEDSYHLESSNEIEEHSPQESEEEHLDLARSNEVEENAENQSDSGSAHLRYQFSRASDYSVMQNDIDPLAGISEFDTNAMGDGTHNRPNFLQVYVNFFDEENDESEWDGDY